MEQSSFLSQESLTELVRKFLIGTAKVSGGFCQRLVSVDHIHDSDWYLQSGVDQRPGYVQSFLVRNPSS
jgi:hypothetical protein